MTRRWVVAALSAALAGCLSETPLESAPERERPPQEPGNPPPTLPLSACRGVIHRFLVDAAQIRPFVHPAFALYEGTDAQPLPGSGRTLASISIYACRLSPPAPASAALVAILFARVADPAGGDDPLPYVVRLYASNATVAGALGTIGIPGGAAAIETHEATGPATWVSQIDDAQDGHFFGLAAVDPAGATGNETGGPFLAVTANERNVTWMRSDVTVTAEVASCVGEPSSSGIFLAFAGAQEAPCFEAAVVDPLDFPIAFHVVPWDGRSVPPPPFGATDSSRSRPFRSGVSDGPFPLPGRVPHPFP